MEKSDEEQDELTISDGASGDMLLKIAQAMEQNGDITPAEAREIIETAKNGKPIEEEPSGDLRTLLRDMAIPQKVKYAMFGSATARKMLITDANRLVQEAVLKNPQMQDRELLDFASNANVPENVLRRIGSSKSWMKKYEMKLAIVSNPKAPVGLALKWIKFLRKPDLKKMARSKNISKVISTSAKKRLADLEKK